MFALRNFLFAGASLASLAALTGCASSAPTSEASTEGASEATSSTADALTTKTDRFVTVRRDLRRCMAPLCGGYWARELNRDADERYVSSIDLEGAGLDDAAIESALSAVDALVLRGRLGPAERRFGTRPFVASDAWRGMPGVAPGCTDAVYAVTPREPPIACLVAPCPNEIATRVNTGATYAFDGVDVAPAARPFVDTAWLASRVTEHGALIAASWVQGEHFPGGYAQVLRARQVYVHLPDRVGPCPAAPVTRCEEGTIAAYRRSEDRCVIQVACVKPAICPMYLPACADGYTLASWTGESGCAQFACDPLFTAR